MCLLSSACSVYFHISCKERVHCSLGGKRGEGDYIAAMFLKVLQIQSSVGNFNVIQVNMFLSLVPRPHPRGDSLVTFGKSLGFITTWGEFFICQSHCRKHHLWFQHWKPLTTSAWWQQFLWHWKKLAISSQLQAMNFYEARDISQMPFNGWGLGTRQLDKSHGWSHCFVF